MQMAHDHSNSDKPLGVGLIGAGPVTQAIHLPTIATLSDRLKVVHVMDVDELLAATVAKRAGARASTDIGAVLEDPEVDVVAVCSPDRFHADQVIAACEAGKRAVLCEKPLATSLEDAARIAAASRQHGVPVIVGTMHRYDRAVDAALASWEAGGEAAELIRSVLYLPPNDLFVSAATELAAEPAALAIPAQPWSREDQAEIVRMCILGLAIHDIPLLRLLLPRFDEVADIRFLQPLGYVITLVAGTRSAQFIALTPGDWPLRWTLDAFSPSSTLRIDFTPSFVLAGSARAEIRKAGSSTVWELPRNGYQEEWLHLSEVAHGITSPIVGIEEAVDDLTYALELADRSAAHLLAGIP